MRNTLKNLAIKYQGDTQRIALALINHEEVSEYESPTSFITVLDEHYPSSLRCLQQPPFVLFYKGNLDILNRRALSVVGSRQPDEYGCQMTIDVVDHLKQNFVIVSGLALGIDALAHQRAILGGSTIALLGCGIEVTYPRQNRELFAALAANHLILSEYPGRVQPLKHHFPHRNRLIAALGESIFVMAATYQSGTLRTVDHALALGKDIVCLPYCYGQKSGEGCNSLIEQGARILTKQVLLDMI